MQGSVEFGVEQLFDMADSLELAVPDLSSFIDQLNDAGRMLADLNSKDIEN